VVAGRPDLRADCARCFGLCCVVPAFSVSADFAIDKAAGQPCPHLGPGFRCGIHRQLRPRGFPGCAAYDCFGAGQKVAQVTFGGQDWRQAPHTARQMFVAFTVMRQLHELLWYLTQALALPAARPLHGELRRALEQTERLSGSRPDALVAPMWTPAGSTSTRCWCGRASSPGPASGRRDLGPTTGAPIYPEPTCAARACAARACGRPV
jgi:hypothetical protein